MTIAFVNSGAFTSGNDTSVGTLPMPASLVAGNLLIFVFSKASLPSTALATPAGWTNLGHLSDGTRSADLFYKISNGSETSISLDFSGNYYTFGTQCFQYSGTDTVVVSHSNYGASTTHTSNGVTSTKADSLAIYIDTSQSTNLSTTNPSGWTDTSTGATNWVTIDTGSYALTTSGSSTGSISTAGAANFFIWALELKQAPVPIDALAESTSSASAETIAGYGIAAPAESTAAATAETSYIFAIGAFGSSSASLTSVAERIFYGSGIASSSAVVTGTIGLIWEANIIAEAIASVVGAVIGTRNTSGSAESSAVASDVIHGFFILDASALSSGEFTSTADILRSLGAAASSAAVASGNANVRASYSLLAESIATIIDGVQFVNDYYDGWTYNLNIEAPSFYENFKFNSFAKLGQNYYGMASDGIHLLSGENDNGIDINSLIKTGSDDYDDSTIKTIPTIYASARSNKEMILNAKVDDNPAYDYTFIGKPGEIAPIRVKLGRGLKGRSWQIEIRNKDGAFIEIDQLDIPSVSTSRRV